MRVFVSGGGTGGHFFPALAFLECLLERGIESLFVGSKRGIEYRLKERIPVESLFLPSHPFMGRKVNEKFLAVYKNLLSLLQLSVKVRKEAVGVVFGGYASLPLGLACLLKRKTFYLHEQNSIPSQSNSLLSRFAKRIFITFEHSRAFFPKEKVIKTGLPVRKKLLEGRALTEKKAKERLSLEDRFTLLVMGGSQGASFLNGLALEVFSRTGWQGIHITGEKDYQRLSGFYREKGLKVLCLPFSESMELLYRASNIAISRAGAGSITELSLFGIPALFIPFPHAVHDHQFYNAKEIENMGGGIVMKEKEASPDRVIVSLERLLRDRELFSEKIGEFADPVACERMLKYILTEGGLDSMSGHS